VRVIVPFPPGGAVDITSRLLADRLGPVLGQTVVVENRAGAGGSVGAESVARARPDGFTLMVGSNGPLTVNPALQARLPYDAAADFVPIGMAMRVPLVLAAGAQQPFATAAAMLAAARAQPGAVGLGSSGQGSTTHLAIAALNAAAGVEFLHVPYRSGGAILPDLVAGTVAGAMTEISIPLALAREGRIRLLAVTAPARSAVAPEVPTMAEAGLPALHMASFVGLVAPAATPAPVLRALEDAMAATIAEPALRARFLEMGGEGADAEQSRGAGFSAFLRAEAQAMREAARAAGLAPG
jgi:tripartite-type tricarboxylate transporter receptor subunit TctC